MKVELLIDVVITFKSSEDCCYFALSIREILDHEIFFHNESHEALKVEIKEKKKKDNKKKKKKKKKKIEREEQQKKKKNENEDSSKKKKKKAKAKAIILDSCAREVFTLQTEQIKTFEKFN